MSKVAMSKVAVVTGSNKGIGLAVVRGLCKQFHGDVYLTARNEELGKQAVRELNKEGLYPKFHQLDITDSGSIEKICIFLKHKYHGLDLLINNSGVCYIMHESMKYPDDVDLTMDVNYHGTLKVCELLFPILNHGARVVNVASKSGTDVLGLCSESRREKLLHLSTIDDITALMIEFVNHSKNGTYMDEGWPKDTSEKSYGISKFGVIALSELQQYILNSSNSGIVVNSCCPGFVCTDMSFNKGILSPDEGADTILYLGLLPKDVTEPKGRFVYKRKVYDWKNGQYPGYENVEGGYKSIIMGLTNK